MSAPLAVGPLVCPIPVTTADMVQLGHGSGGRMSQQLLRERFLPHFDNPILSRLGDGAILEGRAGPMVMTTDSFVVSPIEFPGGNIGSLAVHGTLNDLAMMGAAPLCLSVGFILEEGLPFDVLDRVIEAMGRAAREAGVPIATGDTKVVERGKADGVYINTTGIGWRQPRSRPAAEEARPGDVIIVSGPLGRHGMAIMAAREGLGFEAAITSDSANLWPIVERLLQSLGDAVHVLRDPTRGGAASALNEIAAASGVGIVLEEAAIPVPEAVASACEILGLDPLYVANEGVFLAFVAPEQAETAVALLRAQPLGAEARVIGRVDATHPGFVIIETALGGTRIIDMLPGDQLPRIC